MVYSLYHVLVGSGRFIVGCFFFQAEDGIRDLVRSRGLGDVYKRQPLQLPAAPAGDRPPDAGRRADHRAGVHRRAAQRLSLIHI